MKKKLIILAVLVLSCLCLLAGCNKYHAEFYSHAVEWIDADFLKENRVKAYYPNEDYVEGVTDPMDSHIYDNESPESRTFIINEQSEFDRIFSRYNSTVDMEKKSVILHILPDIYPRKYYLKNLKLEDKQLTVNYKIESNNGKADAVPPYQRCFAVIMDKVEITSAVFIEQR